MKVKGVDFFPLTMIIIYISMGVLLSFFGPVEYYGYDKMLVGVYMLSFLVLFTVGYIFGLRENLDQLSSVSYIYQHKKAHDRYDWSQTRKIKRILFWVKFCILIISAQQAVNILLGVSDGSLNLSVSKMGEAYVNAYTDYERGTGQVSSAFLLQTLTYVPYLVTLILGAYYYERLPKAYRWLVIFSYFSIILLETIGHGKQKQFGDILVFLVVALALKSNLYDKKKRRRAVKRMMFIGALGVSGLVTVLYYRYLAIGVNASNINKETNPLMLFDTNHAIFKFFGDELGFPIATLTTYFSQGYYGLSISMREPFVWTYLVGNSYSLTVFLHRFLGLQLDYHDTYPYRAGMHSAWDESKWSTAIAWFAGDVTFIGVLLVFAGIAFFYAKVWRESFRYQNPISIILFANLTIGLLYVPANNQLLHSPGSVLALFSFFFIWFLKHRGLNFYAKNNRNLTSKES